jgi:hypothetical protein
MANTFKIEDIFSVKGKVRLSTLPVYCAFALALLEQIIAITLDFFETTGSTGLSLLVDGRCHRRRIRIRKGYVTQASHTRNTALRARITPQNTTKHTIHNKNKPWEP